jgi:starch synthase (maltosyl-transferring)
MGCPVGAIPVLDVSPTVEGGRFAAKAVVGERITVSATVFREGHELAGATAVLTRPDGTSITSRMTARPPGEGPRRTDWWTTDVTVDTLGDWTLVVEGWGDTWGTWRHNLQAKLDAGQDSVELGNDLETGARMLAAQGFSGQAAMLRDAGQVLSARVGPALALADIGLRELVTPSKPYPLVVEREQALRGFWYELFPRSHGGLRGVAKHLPYVASLGADVLYLPPIHPIGTTHRKGRNNTLVAGTDDVGSPWAIGSSEGGHDAIHPDLGTEEDLVHLVTRARELGMEVALDLALQASPDHPWVSKHPEWFTVRPDGTIAYAENPPKKYQDIHPLDCHAGGDPLRQDVLRVVRHWIDLGIRVFRVDNPHTKPVELWQWLLEQVRRTHPDVIWLSEAFTRPPMLHVLAMVGFSQSYTYITWRTSKHDVVEYLTELTSPPATFYLRPNLFCNTPDILHESLVHGGLPMFRARSALCAAASPVWGIYEGFELGENVPVREGSEEYLDSEKYQLRPRDLSDPPLRQWITELNVARREHPALQQLAGLTMHETNHDQIVAFSRRHDRDVVLAIVAVDPNDPRETTLSLDLNALGVTEPFVVTDLIGRRETYTWGPHPFVRLTPEQPAHLLHVRQAP